MTVWKNEDYGGCGREISVDYAGAHSCLHTRGLSHLVGLEARRNGSRRLPLERSLSNGTASS